MAKEKYWRLVVLLGPGVSPGQTPPTAPGVDRQRIEQAYKPRRLGLVIGINQFRDPNWRSLRYAEDDARAMAAAMRDPEIGYFDEVIELLEPWETSRQGIREALRILANRNMSTEDTVLIYISTHGTLDRDRNGRLHQYLVTYDTDFNNIPGTGLDQAELVLLQKTWRSGL